MKAVLQLCEKVLACRKCPLKYLGIMGIRSATYFQMVQRENQVLYCSQNLSDKLKLFPKYAKKKIHVCVCKCVRGTRESGEQ